MTSFLRALIQDDVVDKQEKPEVVVEKIVRNKRKCVTIIKGLDMFGKLLSVGT